MEAALSSPFAIEKLLNRLKQSIFSAREFSGFLKERSAIEDRHAQGYKKLLRHATESIRKPEARQGSYAKNFAESLQIHDRMAENTLQLSAALTLMADEVRDMAENAERGRKQWKHATIDAEKKLSDAESAQQKAKDRYNAAAEQYDRVRTGEKQAGKFGLKNKSPAQQEEALKEKADMLDQEYGQKTQTAQVERREFEGTTKPQIVRSLQDLIKECDAGLSMQMAKLASLGEKHIVSNGMAVAPIRHPDSTGPEPRGLRHVAQDIDDERDFQDYMLDGAEPPPQFKGRSRRNTDADRRNMDTGTIETPAPTSTNFESRSSYDFPHNNSRPNVDRVESTAPQLPQIGGQDSGFGNSFEMQRPSAYNENSYTTGQSDMLSKANTNHSQLTGVTRDTLPSQTPTNTSAPPLPPYDGPSTSYMPGAFNSAPSQNNAASLASDRNSGPTKHDLTSPTTGFNRGPDRADTTLPDFSRSQGLAGSETVVGRENPYLARQSEKADTMLPDFSRSQGPTSNEPVVGRENPYSGRGPERTDTMLPEYSRGQGPTNGESVVEKDLSRGGPIPGTNGSPVVGRENPYLGRGGPAPGSYMDPGKTSAISSLPSAGRGQMPAAQRNLPSQQQQRPMLPPNNPVFGMHLDDLFRRDGSAVPAIVFQCIQAVDNFGLHTEGIYRISGPTPTVMQLKSEFDHGKSTNQILRSTTNQA